MSKRRKSAQVTKNSSTGAIKVGNEKRFTVKRQSASINHAHYISARDASVLFGKDIIWRIT
jgi:hypothetical protein